jgi:hypothetical protein
MILFYSAILQVPAATQTAPIEIVLTKSILGTFVFDTVRNNRGFCCGIRAIRFSASGGADHGCGYRGSSGTGSQPAAE